MAEDLDCLVVGGGPAGLTAAIYLARFRLSVQVIDDGQSRAALIPCTRNHAGFPGGIAGGDLLARMREQALEFGADLKTARVGALRRPDAGFHVESTSGRLVAETVLIATGVTNRRPAMSEDLHARALSQGRLRYCPVCDGYEVTDQRVAVIGAGDHGIKEALFLRAYTKSVTLIPNPGARPFSAAERRQLTEAEIVVVEAPAVEFALQPDGIDVRVGDERLSFSAIYPALGSEVHSQLAAAVGAERTEEGCIKVDAHQRTSVTALYAAGDVVIGLDQISHAMGEAGVAATAIRNDLSAKRPLLR